MGGYSTFFHVIIFPDQDSTSAPSTTSTLSSTKVYVVVENKYANVTDGDNIDKDGKGTVAPTSRCGAVQRTNNVRGVSPEVGQDPLVETSRPWDVMRKALSGLPLEVFSLCEHREFPSTYTDKDRPDPLVRTRPLYLV